MKSSVVAARSVIAFALFAALLLARPAAGAEPEATPTEVEPGAPVSITNFSLQGFAGTKSGESAFVPGIRAVFDFWAGHGGDAAPRVWWLHGVMGTSGGFGGAGKISAELYMALGASFSPHPLAAIGFLYEPLGYWVTPQAGVAGAGADLRVRVWRLQVELGQRGQGVFLGVATGDIKQRRVVLKALIGKYVVASVEHYPSPSGIVADSCTNFVLGVTAF